MEVCLSVLTGGAFSQDDIDDQIVLLCGGLRRGTSCALIEVAQSSAGAGSSKSLKAAKGAVTWA